MKTAEQMKRQAIKRHEQKKYILKFIAYVIAVLFILIMLMYSASTKPVGQATQVITHTVRQGEHLDDIARKYYPDMYVLEARSEIKNLNNMTESDIYAGQVLKIELKEVK
jgi:LysM repeat protein